MQAGADSPMNRLQILLRFARNYFHVAGRPLPTFLIIGAQKAGTSSLFEYLAEHPDVSGSFIKEVHFFSRRHFAGVRAYRAIFPFLEPAAGRPMHVGEASPVYLFDEKVPARVWSLLPQVKLIAMLREPVSRAYSHYQHNVRRGRERRSFEEAVEDDLRKFERGGIGRQPDETYEDFRQTSYVRRGFYLEQIERWFRLFDRRNFLLIRAEDFFSQPTAVTRRSMEFLGLAARSVSTGTAHNQFAYQRKGRGDFPALEEVYASANDRLREQTGIAW